MVSNKTLMWEQSTTHWKKYKHGSASKFTFEFTWRKFIETHSCLTGKNIYQCGKHIVNERALSRTHFYIAPELFVSVFWNPLLFGMCSRGFKQYSNPTNFSCTKCDTIQQNESEVKIKCMIFSFLAFFKSFFCDFLTGYCLGFSIVRTP